MREATLPDDAIATGEVKHTGGAAKKAWVSPRIIDLRPGSAEFGVAKKGDGAGGGSIHS